MVLRGLNGKYYNFAQSFFKRGGEGDIFEIQNYPSKLAKVYHSGFSTKEMEEKLKYMISNPPSNYITNQVAWPIDILYDSLGVFCGFVMNKLDIDVDLNSIYSYPQTNNISVKHKLIIAQNICVVIDKVHSAGYVFGDFNPSNIGINLKTGLVAFMDTDSYHIVDKKTNKVFRCKVCASGYEAPELLERVDAHIVAHPEDKSFAYEKTPLDTFTRNTDNFALAIHIFKLLNNGFTPYNGVEEKNKASLAAPGLGADAIRKDHYCFRTGYKPLSKAVLPFDAHPPYIGALFVNAFISGRINPERRPDAEEWYKALNTYENELVPCKSNPLHMHKKGMLTCPWCEADKRYLEGFMPKQIPTPVATPVVSNINTLSNGNSTINNTVSTPVSNKPNTVSSATTLSAQKKANTSTSTYNSSAKNHTTTAARTTSVSCVVNNNILQSPSLIAITGWLMFIACIAYILNPFVHEWNIAFDDDMFYTIRVIPCSIFAILAAGLLRFTSSYTKRYFEVLATITTIIWGFISAYVCTTAYCVQNSLNINYESEPIKFLGIFLAIYFSVMWLGTRIGNYFYDDTKKAKNNGGFKFFNYSPEELIELIIMIVCCVVAIPILLNLPQFYRIVLNHNTIKYIVIIVPIAAGIIAFFQNYSDDVLSIWLCTCIIIGITCNLLLLGTGSAMRLGVMGFVLFILYLWGGMNLLMEGCMGDEIGSLMMWMMFAVFAIVGYADFHIISDGIESLDKTITYLVAGPSIISITIATIVTIKELSKEKTI